MNAFASVATMTLALPVSIARRDRLGIARQNPALMMRVKSAMAALSGTQSGKSAPALKAHPSVTKSASPIKMVGISALIIVTTATLAISALPALTLTGTTMSTTLVTALIITS